MKIKLASIALSGAMLLSSSVFAAGLDFDPKFYVGGEVQVDKYKGTKEIQGDKNTTIKSDKGMFNKSKPAGSLFVGSRLNDFCAVEAGATAVAGAVKSKVVNPNAATPYTDDSILKLKSRNIHADVLGFVPVADQVELIGSLGVGRLSSKVQGHTQLKAAGNPKVDFTSKSSKVGLRVGAGVGVKLDDNISARLMVRHQKGNKHVKNVTSAGVGLLYQF